MNRLIIIGNGFDLAHNLPTSYKDFFEWYWCDWREKLYNSNKKKEIDNLCEFQLQENSLLEGLWTLRNIYPQYFEKNAPVKDFFNAINTGKMQCVFNIQSVLLRAICQSYETSRWVDIEKIFYHLLCNKTNPVVSPQKLNDDMDFLRVKLSEYLGIIQKNISPNINKTDICQKLFDSIKKQDIAIGSMAFWNNTRDEYCYPKRTMILSFNYTSIADIYFNSCDYNRYVVNHIHGKLEDPQNMIFGYGDEMDSLFQTIVNKNENNYLNNIKSIKYLESANYRQLLSFLDSDAFQIYIMGHSCGNSDRTLLNTLFEHENCVSIKPYYHKRKDGTDNYTDLVQNIYRNFTNMQLMRDRVVNKTFCEPLSEK